MKRKLAWTAVGCLLGLAVPAADRGVPASGAPELEAVLQRFDRAQAAIRTLRAEFTEVARSELLKEPLVARGELFMTKPDAVMWRYTAPEVAQFLIARDEYVGYFPARKQAERRDIHRWRDQIFRYFGVGQASAELRQTYAIRLDSAGPAAGRPVVLVLEPRKRRLQRHIASIRFWLDPERYLPVQIEYEDADGNRRVVRFEKIEINPELSASLFRIEIPNDVTVTTGFAGLRTLAAAE